MRILHKKIVNIQNLEGFWINMSLIFQLLGTKLYSWFFAVFFSIPGTVRRFKAQIIIFKSVYLM